MTHWRTWPRHLEREYSPSSKVPGGYGPFSVAYRSGAWPRCPACRCAATSRMERVATRRSICSRRPRCADGRRPRWSCSSTAATGRSSRSSTRRSRRRAGRVRRRAGGGRLHARPARLAGTNRRPGHAGGRVAQRERRVTGRGSRADRRQRPLRGRPSGREGGGATARRGRSPGWCSSAACSTCARSPGLRSTMRSVWTRPRPPGSASPLAPGCRRRPSSGASTRRDEFRRQSRELVDGVASRRQRGGRHRGGRSPPLRPAPRARRASTILGPSRSRSLARAACAPPDAHAGRRDWRPVIRSASSRRSRARIAASSSGWAWSQPQRWSDPCVTSSRSSSAAVERTSPV